MCKDFVVADRDTDPPDDPKPEPEYNKYQDERWGKTPEEVAEELCKALRDIAS